MRPERGFMAATATVVLVALAGVGTPAAARAPGPDDVVLQVATGGGFVPEEIRLGEIPEVTVYRDGRVITLGPTTAQYPGPAIPNLQEFRIAEAGIDRLIDRAAAAGVLRKRSPNYGSPQVTDNPTTSVTVRVRGNEHSVSLYALGFDDDRLSDVQRANRQRLQRLIRRAGDERAQRRYVVERNHSYEPAAIDVHLFPIDVLPAPDGIPWPLNNLAELSNATRDTNSSCLTIIGDDAVTLLAAARQAQRNTVWESGGSPYNLVFRPLLPGEEGCAD